MVLITEKDISMTYNHFNMKQVETQLQDQEYELLKAFKEKNGLKTDYQGLKELVKALDIPEFHEEVKTEEKKEVKTEEKKEVKTEVKPIDRTNLENWVKDLGFEQQPTTVTNAYNPNEQLRINAIHALWEVTNFVASHTLITHGTGGEQTKILRMLAQIREQIETLSVRDSRTTPPIQ